MRRRALIVIGIMLFVLGQIGVNFLIYKYKNSNVEIPKVQLRDVKDNKKDKKKSFAIMLEQDDGSYKTTSSNSFDHPGYVYNSRKSKCVDDYGNVVENILNYDNDTKMMGVKTSKTAYCYVYFDKLKNLYEACGSNNMSSCESSGKLISVENLWQSGLEGDGYRYVGTNPNNYICFGTTNKSTCTGNTDAYMYRIIGIFADSSGNQYLKLIKKEALNTAYTWNDSNSDVDWGASTLKSNLNGNIYLTNTTYMPTGWSNRIKEWTWSTVNTLTSPNFGPHYNSFVIKEVYLHEMNKNNKTNNIGSWITSQSKIGIMYVHDYLMSIGNNSLNSEGSLIYETLKAGWMHIANNDNNYPVSGEWTIARYGIVDPYYAAWDIRLEGTVSTGGVTNFQAVRPVFYLEKNQVIKSGTGTLSDPYILK